MSDQQAAAKPRNALWVKGQSGNPAGRPKGSRNAITLAKISMESELRAQAGPQMARVLEKAIELALQGDTAMIKLLMDQWMSKSRSGNEDDSPREKIQIVIGKLDQVPEVKGRVFNNGEEE